MWIYKIKNDINDKLYIGQSINPLKDRMQRHLTDSQKLNTHFARAMRKYGVEHFTIEVIKEGITDQEVLTQREQYWIRYYDSIKKGYNETDAACKSGGNTYMSKTEEEMDQIKQKIRITKLGSLNPHSVKVKMINTLTNEETIFDTMKQCYEFFNQSNHSFVSKRCRGVTKCLYKNIYKFEYVQ